MFSLDRAALDALERTSVAGVWSQGVFLCLKDIILRSLFLTRADLTCSGTLADCNNIVCQHRLHSFSKMMKNHSEYAQGDGVLSLDLIAQAISAVKELSLDCPWSKMGSGASAVKEPEPNGLTDGDLTESEKTHMEAVLRQTKTEVLDQINQERMYRGWAMEWKADLSDPRQKFNRETSQKTVLFISDGIQTWPQAASAAKEDVISLWYPAKEH